MNNKVFFGLLILTAGILVGWFTLQGNTQTSTQNNNKIEGTPASTAGSQYDLGYSGPRITGESLEKGGTKSRIVVVYSDIGFSPSDTTVKKGETVTFVNESSRAMWVASDVHPTHQLLPGFDELASVGKGGTYDYVFVKVGSWRYHNHLNPSDGAVVTVTE